MRRHKNSKNRVFSPVSVLSRLCKKVRRLPIYLLIGGLWLAGGMGCSDSSGAQSAAGDSEGAPSGTELYLPHVVNLPQLPQLLGTMQLNASPQQAVVNRNNGRVYVLTTGSVAVIEGLQLVKEIPLPRPNLVGKIALDEAHDRVYVSYGLPGQEVTVIELEEIVASISLPLVSVDDMAVHPETNELYIAGMKRENGAYVYSELIVVRDNDVISRLNIGRGVPRNLIIDAVYDYIYVNGTIPHPEYEFEKIGTVTVIQNNAVQSVHEMGQYIEDMALDVESGRVWVMLGAAYAYDPENPVRLEDMALFEKGELLILQKVSELQHDIYNHVLIHPKTGDFYATGGGLVVMVGKEQNGAIVAQAEIEVGHSELDIGMAIDPISGNYYRANQLDDNISVIHGVHLLGEVEVGYQPKGLAVNPNNGWLYVPNSRSFSVSVLGYPESLSDD